MKKIPSLYKRAEGDRLVYDAVVPGCEWVLEGAGVATIKWDGTACKLEGGFLLKRYNRKRSRHTKVYKPAPPGWVAAQEFQDRHWPGWVPCSSTDPADQYYFEALEWFSPTALDGTYELVGPKVQGNPYGLEKHLLWRHGSQEIKGLYRAFENIQEWLIIRPNTEGIVWHHPDGDKAKIKRKDFGLEWPPNANKN